MDKAGVTAHSAEPADTSALRGPKRRVKTDKADAKPDPAQEPRGFLAVENAYIASYVAEVQAETLSHLALSWV